MIDWFKYYKKKFKRTGKAMIYILYDAEMNPFCNDIVIRKLCRWLDADTNKRFGRHPKIEDNNSYKRYREVIRE